MTQESTLSAELLQAFNETDYIVHHEQSFTMNIGLLCTPNKALMGKHNAQCAAYITAWNPFSQQVSRQQNEARKKSQSEKSQSQIH